MTVRLCSYAVEGFRCFSDRVDLRNLARVNVIAGPNNIGKSALFAPIRRLTRLDSRYLPAPDSPAAYGRWGGLPVRFDAQDCISSGPVVRFEMEADAINPDDIKALGGKQQRWVVVYQPPDAFEILANWDEPGSQPQIVASGEEAVAVTIALMQRVVFVPPTRRATATLAITPEHLLGERLYSGETLFSDVLDWSLTEAQRERRDRLEEFASSVLGQQVTVRGRARPAQLSVTVGDDPPRPLAVLGQGIEQVLTIGAAAAMVGEPILILEEPELALHPLIQRRLIETLARMQSTTFVTTHSNHILDATSDGIRHYHLQCEKSGKRVVREADSAELKLLRDLGVRPSSLLQANAVIWVEGPSDAAYLRAWLRAFGGQELIEGSDFAFVHYGGALLDHVRESEAPGQVCLQWLNPSWFLVADSDRSAAAAPLGKEYTERLAATLRPERRWITQGREVESYLNDDELVRALSAPGRGHSKATKEPSRYEKLDARLSRLGLPTWYGHSKVDLAVKVLKQIEEWPDRLDLADRMTELLAFIQDCKVGVAT